MCYVLYTLDKLVTVYICAFVKYTFSMSSGDHKLYLRLMLYNVEYYYAISTNFVVCK